MKGGLLLSFLFLLLFPVTASGADAVVSGEEALLSPDRIQQLLKQNEVPLSLQACLQLALKNNLEIAIERINPAMSRQRVEQAKSDFDPVVSLTLSKDRSVRQVGSALALPSQNEREDLKMDAGISGKWVTGTETELHFTSNRNITNSIFAGLNPSYSSELILSLTQPLLKDFGISANTTALRIASNNETISQYRFADQVMRILYNVESAYWELVYAKDALQVAEKSLKRSEDFLKLTEGKVNVGLLPKVEVLYAEAEQAARKEGVISARDRLQDDEDLLRRLLNLSDMENYWEIHLVPTDSPRIEPVKSNLTRELQEGLKHRPDLNQARMDLENRKIRFRYTRNQLLPRVDLIGSLGLSGLAGKALPQQDFQDPTKTVLSPFNGNYNDSLKELESGGNYSYSLGIQVTYPLGNREAKSKMVLARLKKRQALFGLRDLENRVIQEIREAYRQIRTNRKRIAATEAARKLAGERLKSETRRFKLGMATSHDVLEDQEKFALAQRNELQARIDYRTSRVNLERVKGTLLAYKGIILEPGGSR
ncbi:MAG: TolC family protein [Deltaproteobacteria bacterium]|nr:TolC family protein [Deltaproteobacteria bacterium]